MPKTLDQISRGDKKKTFFWEPNFSNQSDMEFTPIWPKQLSYPQPCIVSK